MLQNQRWNLVSINILVAHEFKNSKNVIISIYLLYVGGLSLIISDQEDESIWKILVMEKWLPDISFKT